MDFDQLITFLEVARQGSFSRAGEKVFRSQSAVSAQIRQLEQEYGDRLLDRSGKTVKLAPGGLVGNLALTWLNSGLLFSFGVPVDQSTKSRQSWALSLLAVFHRRSH